MLFITERKIAGNVGLILNSEEEEAVEEEEESERANEHYKTAPSQQAESTGCCCTTSHAFSWLDGVGSIGEGVTERNGARSSIIMAARSAHRRTDVLHHYVYCVVRSFVSSRGLMKRPVPGGAFCALVYNTVPFSCRGRAH